MENKRNQSYALRHALALLECLAQDENIRGMSLKDLVTATGLNKSTVLRLLMPLLEQRLVTKSSDTGQYHLGLKVVEWAGTYLSQAEIARIALPHLHRLVEATGETAFLVVYDDGDVVFLAKVESPNKIRMSSNIGTRTSAYSTANGKAILAFLPESEVDRIIARGLHPITPHTVISPAALKAQLQQVRERHYAFDDRENAEDARCIGAPIFDFRGQVAGGISLSGPAFRMELARTDELGQLVWTTAQAISRELGYAGAEVRTAPALYETP